MDPLILQLGTRGGWEVALLDGSFAPQRKSLLYLLNEMLIGSHSCSGYICRKVLPLPGIEAKILDRPARSLITTLTQLPWLEVLRKTEKKCRGPAACFHVMNIWMCGRSLPPVSVRSPGEIRAYVVLSWPVPYTSPAQLVARGQTNFTKNPSSGSGPDKCGLTDKQTRRRKQAFLTT